jgi:hypothetical protein
VGGGGGSGGGDGGRRQSYIVYDAHLYCKRFFLMYNPNLYRSNARCDASSCCVRSTVRRCGSAVSSGK